MTQQTTQTQCFADVKDLSYLQSISPSGSCHHLSHRRRIAQKIARNRIIRYSASNDVTEDSSTAFYRRRDLLGCDNAYKSCIFLDPHGTVAVACDTVGRMDVVRLPDFGHEGSTGRLMGKLLAEKLSVRQSECTGGGFHLKSIAHGNAFCAGMPNGEFVVFATERATDLGRRYDLSENTARMYQENQTASFIKTAWNFAMPTKLYGQDHQLRLHANGVFSQSRSLDNSNAWIGRRSWEESNLLEDREGTSERKRECYENIHRWAFLETASSAILAAHVDVDIQGVSLNVKDSRLQQIPHKSAIHIDLLSSSSLGVDDQEDVSSVCWMSDNMLLTSHVQNVDQGNVLKLWDVRSNRMVENHSILSFPSDSTTNTKSERRARILRLMSSVDASGTVLVTMEQSRHANTSYEHQLIDVGTWQLLQRVQPSTRSGHGMRSPTTATSQRPLVDAVTPHLDYLASYESPSIEFHDLSSSNDRKTPSSQTTHVTSRGTKRRSDGDEIDYKSDEFMPKLVDGNSLPTKLSCMSFDFNGTALIGGSLDGDLFVWRGG
jgi:hypothetical protein